MEEESKIFIIKFTDDKGKAHEWPFLSTSVARMSSILERLGYRVQDIREGRSKVYTMTIHLKEKEDERAKNEK